MVAADRARSLDQPDVEIGMFFFSASVTSPPASPAPTIAISQERRAGMVLA